MSAWREIHGLYLAQVGALTSDQEQQVLEAVQAWGVVLREDLYKVLDLMEDRFRDQGDLPTDPVGRARSLAHLSKGAANAYHEAYARAGKKPLFPFILALPNGPPLHEILMSVPLGLVDTNAESSFQMANRLLSDQHDRLMWCLQTEVSRVGRPLKVEEVVANLRNWGGILNQEAAEIWAVETGQDNPDLVEVEP